MPKLTIGQPAPGFCLQDLEGNSFSLEDLRGRVALVNFWSAECPHVERTDRELLGWLDRVALVTIAANANEPLDLLRQAQQERNLPLVLRDPDQTVVDLYGAVTTPHCFLIDENGRLRYQGAFDDVTFRQRVPTRNYVLEALDALRSGRSIAVEETSPYGCTIVRAFSD